MTSRSSCHGMSSGYGDAVEDFSQSLSPFSRKESLEEYLPSQIAALAHVVDLVDALAATPEDFAVEAARRGDFHSLRQRVMDVYCDVASLLIAVRRGETAILDTIRDYLPLHRVLEEVKQCERLHIMKILCSWCDSRSKCLPHLLSAAAKGRAEIMEFAGKKTVEYLLATYALSPPLSSDGAANWKLIQTFMDRNRDLQLWYCQAFHEAMCNGQVHAADIIYACFPYSERENLLTFVVHADNASAMEYIFRKVNNKRKFIRSGAMRRAFDVAVKKSRCGVLPALIKWGRMPSKVLELAFTRAVRAGMTDVATSIYTTERIPRVLVDELFKNTQSADEMQTLLGIDQISPVVLTRTFVNSLEACIKYGSRVDAEIIEVLSESDCMPEELMKRALMTAVNLNSELLIHALSGSRLLSSGTVSSAFTSACTNTKMKIVMFMCTSGYVLPSVAAEAFVTAIRADNDTVVNFLWGQQWVSHKVFTDEFLKAAEVGDLKVVEWFCANHRVSHKLITRAFVAGANAGHVAVARCMYGMQRARPQVMSDLMERALKMQHWELLNLLEQHK